MLALLLAQALQSFEPFPPTPFDRVIPIVIDANDAVLAGHGRAERVTYKAEFSGTLHFWTKSAGELDLFLRVETPSGELVQEDDNSGGGKTPYLKLEVEPGRELVIVTAVAEGEGLGSPELCAIAAPETDETRAVADAARLAIADVSRLLESGKRDEARTRARATLDTCSVAPAAASSERVCATMWALGFDTYTLSEFLSAEAAWTRTLRHRLRTLPEEHVDVQKVRGYLAMSMKERRDYRTARVLEEQILAAEMRTLPEADSELQSALVSLAITLGELGDLQGARSLEERVLAIRTRTLPEEDPDLNSARANLAITLGMLGDLQGARSLEERVLDVAARTLPEEHADLQEARENLAATMAELGDLQSARALQERVLAVRSRTLPEDDPALQSARANLAITLGDLGELNAARALEEKVLACCSKLFPSDHPDVLSARESLAGTLAKIGDVQAARALEDGVLEARERTLPEEHLDLQQARMNMALLLTKCGDPKAACALQERALEFCLRTLPEEHPRVQAVRENLASTLARLGDHQRARALFAQVLDVRTRTLPTEHPDLLAACQNLAAANCVLGDFGRARALAERVLEARTRVLPLEHPDMQAARQNLAIACLVQAAAAVRRASESRESATTSKAAGALGATLLAENCETQARVARGLRFDAPGREAEERCASLAERLGFTLSVALGFGGVAPCQQLEAAAFLCSESTRAAAMSSSAVARRAARAEGYADARGQLRRATEELARLLHVGTSGEAYRTALFARESAERVIKELGREASPSKSTSVDFDLETLRAALTTGTAVVAYRSYARCDLKWATAANANEVAVPERTEVDSLCAFVVRSRDAAKTPDALASLSLCDLGPIEPITAAIKNWRDALGASDGRGVSVASRAADPGLVAHGAELRRFVFDPLRKALGDAQHVVVVLDGPLQLVPLDALPAGDDDSKRLGDTLRLETRATLGELLDAPLPLEGERVLVGLGGAEFDGERAEAKKDGDSAAEASAVIAAAVPAKGASLPSILRGGAFGTGFTALPGTLRELDGLEREFAESAGADAKLTVLRGKDATKDALLAAAPRARWLHIATHGWFAPESIRSWEDRDPIDAKSGLAFRQSGEETVKGMSPMLLCGLALAGANLPEDAVGRAPGLLTADELSTLDLSNCELAVLSACDTARGEMRRAGQGVASLQKALQIAGARSVITSLWKVPDEATKELMLDFYRRLWVDKKPKWRALWEAKTKLRNAKDERGAPKYTTRDWAAWVLTGEPN